MYVWRVLQKFEITPVFGSAVRELSDVGESGGRLIFAQNDSSV